MRFGPLVFPVIALALAGFWIANQHRSISALEDASAELQHHLAAARFSSLSTDPTDSKSSAATQATKTKVSLDWEKIAAQFLESERSGLVGDLRTMTQLQQRLQAMSKEELCAALDEVAALDLPAKSRTTLGLMFLEPLAAKDPELALTRFICGIQYDSVELSWQPSNILKQLATKDSIKASAWLDQQIATGKFDSKSLDGHSISRNFFEASLIERAAESATQSVIHERKITREDLDILREWTTRQAPASTDHITGKAIGDAGRYGGKLD